jgi:hypothetical protein
VLHAVRLMGVGESPAVAARFGLPSHEANELLLDAEARGWVTHSSFGGLGGWSLTERGRVQNEALLAAELVGSEGVVRASHAVFLPLNARFQNAVSRWQLRPLPGNALAANDHTDHRWDDRVLQDLGAQVAQVTPVCQSLAAELQRFDGYASRLAVALRRAEAGERSAVDGLRGDIRRRDSLHTVWFELHEDLIATLGITR